MKRECLLSSAYVGPEMELNGVKLAYSPLVNELVRQLKCSFFTSGGTGQTDTGGLVEGIMIMYWLACGEKAKISAHMKKTPEDRSEIVTSFYLENEEGVDTLKPQIIDRMQAAMAASVENEEGGKSGQGAVQAS